MIQFEKINQKGDRLKAYTHKSYLSNHYNSQICRIQKRNQTISNVICYGSSIISYWALNNLTKLTHLVEAKLHFQGRYLALSALVGLVNSFVASVFLTKSVKTSHQSMLKNQVFPAWLHKQNVINPDRVFFELDDNKQNEPTIWHSGITYSSIEKLVPDFIVGNPNKPHIPIAQVHHH